MAATQAGMFWVAGCWLDKKSEPEKPLSSEFSRKKKGGGWDFPPALWLKRLVVE